MTQTLIENAVTLADIAKVIKSPGAQVEADALELSLYVGHDWAGRPAISVTDAAGLVSGAARRDRDHTARWQAHTAASEGWELQREQVRSTAFEDAYEASLRQGRGAPAAAAAGHEAAREVVRDFERKTPPPEFNGAETAPRLFTQMKNRVKEVVR